MSMQTELSSCSLEGSLLLLVPRLKASLMLYVVCGGGRGWGVSLLLMLLLLVVVVFFVVDAPISLKLATPLLPPRLHQNPFCV